MTTSGVAMGRKISRLVVERPRNRYRTRAKEIIVPSSVAPSVATRPISMLVTNDEQTPGTPHRSVHASSENSFQLRLNLPLGLLKDRAMMTAIGMNRYTSTSTATMPIRFLRSQRIRPGPPFPLGGCR